MIKKSINNKIKNLIINLKQNNLHTVQKIILLKYAASKCPKCGEKDAYINWNNEVECINQNCENFSKKRFNETSKDTTSAWDSLKYTYKADYDQPPYKYIAIDIYNGYVQFSRDSVEAVLKNFLKIW